jgi:phosphomannomutase
LDPANLVDAQAAVREHGADLALVFDGDADRCFVIDERGEVVNPSAITALIASRELAKEPGGTIVVNKITSWGVSEVVAAAGGHTVVTRVGHTFVKAAMAEHDAIFGGEHSAHYYFRDFWGADSGMLAALHVLAALGGSDRPLSELTADYQRYEASGEINFTVADAPACVEAVLKSFGTAIQSIDHLDGVTIDLGEGTWFNLRTSNTEPLLRLNVEGRTTDDVHRVVDRVEAQIAAIGEQPQAVP